MSEQTGAPAPVSRDELEYVTRNLVSLQGLRYLPLVPALLLWTGSESGVLTGDWWLWAFLAALVAGVVGVVLMGRWYAQAYGSVARRFDESSGRRIAIMIAALTGFAVIMWVDGRIGLLPELPAISVYGAIAGIALTIAAFGAGPVARRVHPWLHRGGIALTVVSLVPLGLLDGLATHPLNVTGILWSVLVVYLLVVALDLHRALTRLLPATQAGTR